MPEPVEAAPPAALTTLSEDEHLFYDSVRQFAADRVAPRVRDMDERQAMDAELVRALFDLGVMGIEVPEAHGGAGATFFHATLAIEALSAVDPSVGVLVDVHNTLVVNALLRWGTPAQQARLLPRLASSAVGAYALSEPEAGSDAFALTTRAERDGDGWVLRGGKTFITNGVTGDAIVVAARTSEDGISLFLVERGDAGLAARRVETVGWRTSQTGELSFDGVPLPRDRLLGEENQGFPHLMAGFAWERLTMALAAVSGAERTLQLGIDYAREREAFGRPVLRFQVWRHRFADLATEIEAARSLTYHALRTVIAGEDATRQAAMAKWFATELSWRVADEALQAHGGYGYMMEYPVQRAWRDSRLGPIGGGTTEIMKEIIGRSYGL